MELSSLITEDCVKTAVLFNSKKRLFEFVADLANEQNPELLKQDVIDALLNREKLGSTGIGKGIAIPHGRLTNLAQIHAFLIINQKPILFDAIDDKPVDIFFVLLVPESQCQEHLKTLATIADKLKNKDFCKKLRHAQSTQEVCDIISSN